MTDMAQAHERDYRVKDRMDDVTRAIRALLKDDDAIGRLSLDTRGEMESVARKLEKRSAHIVAVWD